MIDRSALLRLGVVLACALAAGPWAGGWLGPAGAVLAQSAGRSGTGSSGAGSSYAGVAVNGQTADDAPASRTPLGEDKPLKVHVFTFEHQSADDALGEIRPLFSDRGSVELKQGGDTVILRDGEDELEKILRTLRDFDHPRRSLRLEFRLLRAHRVPFSPQQTSEGVSPALVARLKQVLRYDTYESLAEVGFTTGEGERVAYDFGDDLGMEFRVGTVLQDTRLGLKDFRLLRHAGWPDRLAGPPGSGGGLGTGQGGPGLPGGPANGSGLPGGPGNGSGLPGGPGNGSGLPGGPANGSGLPGSGLPVLHANLVLRLGQTLAMVLMRDEAASSALVIAITCDPVAGEPKG